MTKKTDLLSEISTNLPDGRIDLLTSSALRSTLSDVINYTFPFGLTRFQALTDAHLPDTFSVSGFSTPGDLGAGAVYTSQGATSAGPMAFQNNGVWYQLVLGGEVNVGWFGAKCDGTVNDLPALDAAVAACFSNKGGTVKLSGQIRVDGPWKIGPSLLTNWTWCAGIRNARLDSLISANVDSTAESTTLRTAPYLFPVSIYSDNATIIANFTPSVPTPVIEHNLKEFSSSTITGNLTIVSSSAWDNTGKTINNTGTVGDYSNKLIGVACSGRGLSLLENVVVSNMSYGIIRISPYWTTTRSIQARSCGDCVTIVDGNASTVRDLEMVWSLRGLIADGSCCQFTDLNTENVREELTFSFLESCKIGPAYMEDGGSSVDGAGYYSITFGVTINTTFSAIFTSFEGLRPTSNRTGKQGVRLWGVELCTFQDCRFSPLQIVPDNQSYCSFKNCDIESGNFATLPSGTFPTEKSGYSSSFAVEINAANDAAAATAGVRVGQMYRNGSILMIRVA
jgi:hypothetical protein